MAETHESAPRALLLGDVQGPAAPGARTRVADFVELLSDAGWKISAASTIGLEDSHQTRDLRRAGIPVYDGSTAQFESVVARGAYQVVICSAWEIAELHLAMLRRASPESAVIVDAPHLQCIRDAQRAFDYARSTGARRRLGADYGSEITGEISVYASVEAVLTGNASQAAFVNTLLGVDRAISVPDAGSALVSVAEPEQRAGIALASVLPDPDCVDALEQLRREIVPVLDSRRLRRDPILVLGEPTAGATIVRQPGFACLGAVSAPATIAKARLAVMPLCRDVDQRLLVGALRAGTPLVSSSAAVGGLGLEADRDLLIADDPASAAASIERLLADQSLWQELSTRGKERIEGTHGPEQVRSQFLRALELARERRSTKRSPAGEGALETFMLRRHRQRDRTIVPAIRAVVSSAVPTGARILVLSRGSDELLRVGPGTSHFPPLAANGVPLSLSDSEEAITLLEQEIQAGAMYLVVPATAADWLQRYPAFRDHLRARFSVHEESSCSLFQLHGVDSRTLSTKLIAFYLPQFHPTPENDAAWGDGFTEWSNVGRGRPLFPDHYQPHVPGELGFYDLRLAETREAQARLAAEAGIHAFCYYHYWFHGKRLLGRPFDEVLASGRPDFPFCLCWANEPWSRRWDGSEDRVIQAQTYSPDDDREHIRWLIPALQDRRAVTVEGKPMFLVYQPKELPDAARTVDLWRHELRNAGLPGLHLVAVETDRDGGWDASRHGFDATVRFQPRFSVLQSLPQDPLAAASGLRVWDYERTWKRLSQLDPVSYRRYETVCTGWDNSARAGERGWVMHNSSPEAYGRWLGEAIERAGRHPPDQRLVFINAWNEWAEGAHLEPDRRHGRAYLDATRRAVVRPSFGEPAGTAAPKAPPASTTSPTMGKPSSTAGPADQEPRIRAVAFYLPQFHPTSENDAFWGPGFTEWTHVVEAKPLFEGHHQPQLPSHLGFYDLRVPEVREAQAELARSHGVEAFCYWHYWFGGRRLLSAPLDEVIATGRPDFPFCLAWANEPWSRSWLGDKTDILIEGEYSAEDDLAHARWLVDVFADRRYLTVRGRPVFVVYRPKHLQDAQRFTKIIRQECARVGVPDPLLLGTTAWDAVDHRTLGFDGTIEFEPRLGVLGDPLTDRLKRHDYTEARSLMKVVREFPVYPSVVVAWDNTPRRGGGGTVLTDATPEAFRSALAEAAASVAERAGPDRLVFVNAWNEWGEGNRLEPEEQHGLAYLAALREVVFGGPRVSLETSGAPTNGNASQPLRRKL